MLEIVRVARFNEITWSDLKLRTCACGKRYGGIVEGLWDAVGKSGQRELDSGLDSGRR